MMSNKRIWAVLAAIGVVGTAGVFTFRTPAQSAPNAVPEEMRPPEDIPLVRLVVSPEQHHGKRVRIIGFVRLEFEGNVIYVHKEDYQHALLGNGLSIKVPNTLDLQGQKNRNMKYCIIEGTFDAKNTGHLGMWSGSLKNISRFDVWSDPVKPRQ